MRDPKQNNLHLFFTSLIPSYKLLRKNDPLQLAGATAFFTTFAMPPIVFILAQILGLIIGRRTVGRGLIQNIGNNLGDAGAQQVREVLLSILHFSNKWYVIVPGFIFLLFVATTLFMIIKNSLDRIWKVAVTDKPGILFDLSERLRSFAVILLTGFLFFANIFFKSIETTGSNYVKELFSGDSLYFTIIFSEITSIIIVAAWFIMLFRFLGDARPTWHASIVGGILTALLFVLGRVLLRHLLVNSNIGTLYGPSGSMVLVLLFVFYSSIIMYYGACFIAVYSAKKIWPLQGNKKIRNVPG